MLMDMIYEEMWKNFYEAHKAELDPLWNKAMYEDDTEAYNEIISVLQMFNMVDSEGYIC